MGNKLNRFLCLLAAAVLVAASALADIAWPEAATPAQAALQTYISRVNENLATLGQPAVNSLFELYATGATLGVTASDGAEIPEGVELTFSLYNDTLNTLILRVNNAEQFPALAAACIQAASPSVTTLEEALKNPAQHASQVQANPGNSYEDEVVDLNGTSPRTYFAYYPNQYHDGVNWLQMTLVFPLAGYEEAGVAATPSPAAAAAENEYEGYFASDDMTHLEIFTTSTPEPESPAGGWLVTP